MIVDIGFHGNRRTAGPIPARTKPYAVNLSGDAMRQHEKAMEYLHRLTKANSDLQSAMASLSAANAEIDRLNAEVSRLKAELKAEKDLSEKLARHPKAEKASKKQKKDQSSS